MIYHDSSLRFSETTRNVNRHCIIVLINRVGLKKTFFLIQSSVFGDIVDNRLRIETVTNLSQFV
jgi:hypothetical protein